MPESTRAVGEPAQADPRPGGGHIQSEITSVEGFGWAWCSWQIADAADFGASTHRERAWMVATRYEQPCYADHVDGQAAVREKFAHVLKKTGNLPDWMPELNRRIEPYRGRPALPLVTVAEALNLPATWWADTRGKRKVDPRTGRPNGGGSFPLNRVGMCITAPWYGIKFRPVDVPQGEGTTTVSLPDLGVLVGFRRDYPWTYIPARAGAKGTRNIAQIIADAVSPFIGAAVQGEDWYKPVSSYQAALYRLHKQPRTNGWAEDGQQLTLSGKQTLLRTLFAPRTAAPPADRKCAV
ncbi:hypothetical protein ACW69C_30285 [Streptomyces sp. MN3]